MASGTLEVSGRFDLSQFWPRGLSDADGFAVRVDVARDFRFRRDASATFRVTRVFDGAVVHGRATRVAVNAAGDMGVRLQGVDAPELHYRARPLVAKGERTRAQQELFARWSHAYRQHCAESSLVAFLRFVHAESPTNVVRCLVRTHVDEPNEVFDTYGRFVGDVYLRLGRRLVSVGEWLLANGRGLPCLYDSMTKSEINDVRELATMAWRRGRGLWRRVATKLGRFNFGLRFRGVNVSLATDWGDLILPKLFRRQVVHAVNRRAAMYEGDLPSFLARELRTSFMERAPLEDATSTILPESPSRLRGRTKRARW